MTAILIAIIGVPLWMLAGILIWPAVEPRPGAFRENLDRLGHTHPIGGPHLLIALWPAGVVAWALRRRSQP